jgi:hypothetical protein
VKRSATAVAVLCLALAIPAAAGDKDTHVVRRAWAVELNASGERQPVDRRSTFRHCPGDDVTTLYFRSKMVHPSRRNVDYWIGWSHNAMDPESEGYLATERHGWIRQSIGIESPHGDVGFGDGKWTVRLRLDGFDGEPIGKSWIRLKTASGPAC